MIDVVKLNDLLSGNADYITTILERLDCHKLSYRSNEIRFAYHFDSNPTSNMVDINTLAFYSFSSYGKGNIYTLIMNKLSLSFKETLEWVCEVLNITKDVSRKGCNALPFGGFYKAFNRCNKEDSYNYNILPQDILSPYTNKFNELFKRDGISYTTQEKFQIGYDVESNRITIPQWDIEGNLVGIMGRLNKIELTESDMRWMPLIPCKLNSIIYGFHYNYADILKKSICHIGESAKSVMQLDSMNQHIGLAVNTNKISNIQSDLIKTLRVPEIIVGFDEGLSEEDIYNEAIKLKSNNLIYKNKVGYIFDKYNDILPKGSKASPTDLGSGKFTKLMRNYVKYI